MRLIKNSLANTASAFLGPVIALFLTPFYIRYLGLEGFGLVGFFSAFSMLFGIVTASMGKVYLRDLAARVGSPSGVATAPALFKTFLLIFAAIGLVAGIAVAGGSWIISHRIVHLEHLAPATVQACVILIGILIGCSFPTGICFDTLAALEEQARANIAVMAVNILTSAIAATAVFCTHSVVAYYSVTAAGALVTLLVLWSRSRTSLRARLSQVDTWPTVGAALHEGWNDARELASASVGLMWTEAAGVAITQTDRMLIASTLPLSSLGTYNIGSSIGRLVQMICSGYIGAAFPQLCAAAVGPNTNVAAGLAFQQQGIVMALVCAVALPVCSVPDSILRLWIGKPQIVAEAGSVTFIFAIAYGCLALAGPPYNFAVALGRVRYAAISNLFAVLWYPALGLFLVSHYGLIGAAGLWLVYCFQSFVTCTLVARYLLSSGYGSAIGFLRMLLIPLGAWSVGWVVQLIPVTTIYPDVSRILCACVGSLFIFCIGILLVMGLGEMRKLARLFKFWVKIP